MRVLRKTIFLSTALRGMANNAGTSAAMTISDVRPASGVPALPPRAIDGMVCGKGVRTENSGVPRTYCGTMTFWVRTLANPSSRNLACAQATAARSAAVPAGRLPTYVVSDSTTAQATLVLSVWSRSLAALAIRVEPFSAASAAWELTKPSMATRKATHQEVATDLLTI